MSICKGVAGRRGKSPVGIFLHNDAGSQNANAAFYRNWLQSHNLENGFAHYYVASDGTLQAEDDSNCAWHCGNLEGNLNYLSIEVCQSMGELNIFKANEEKALALAAQKCKQYGITSSNSTIMLHREVSATECPHRSVEIHGGAAATKTYFIDRIKQLMNVTETKQPSKYKGVATMYCTYKITDLDKNRVYYFNGEKSFPLVHPDELKIIRQIYRDNNGHDMPHYEWTSKAPWFTRLQGAVSGDAPNFFVN